MGHDTCPQPSKQGATSILARTTYSQTPLCLPKESCAAEQSRDDLVYLGTSPLQPDRRTDENSTPDITTTTGRIHKPKEKRPSRLYHKGPCQGIKSARGGKGPCHTMVPVSIRNQNVRIGHARGSNGQVYGFFDEAGRFRRRVEVDRSRPDADPCPFIVLEPISHEQVLYRRRYQNMSSRRVRSEVRQRLMEGLIGSMPKGEI